MAKIEEFKSKFIEDVEIGELKNTNYTIVEIFKL